MEWTTDIQYGFIIRLEELTEFIKGEIGEHVIFVCGSEKKKWVQEIGIENNVTDMSDKEYGYQCTNLSTFEKLSISKHCSNHYNNN